MKKETISVRKIAICGVLIAMNVIFARFLSIQAWNFRIGFTFISYAVAGMLYGPVEGMIVAVAGDVLGTVLFSSTGAYFPGFTLTAAIEGLVFGFFLRNKVTLPKTVIAVAIEQLFCSLLMNSYWISVMYGKGFLALLPGRFAQACFLFVVELVLIMIMEKTLFPQLRKYR